MVTMLSVCLFLCPSQVFNQMIDFYRTWNKRYVSCKSPSKVTRFNFHSMHNKNILDMQMCEDGATGSCNNLNRVTFTNCTRLYSYDLHMSPVSYILGLETYTTEPQHKNYNIFRTRSLSYE